MPVVYECEIGTLIVPNTTNDAYAPGDFYVHGGITGVCITSIPVGRLGTIAVKGVFSEIEIHPENLTINPSVGDAAYAVDGDHRTFDEDFAEFRVDDSNHLLTIEYRTPTDSTWQQQDIAIPNKFYTSGDELVAAYQKALREADPKFSEVTFHYSESLKRISIQPSAQGTAGKAHRIGVSYSAQANTTSYAAAYLLGLTETLLTSGRSATRGNAGATVFFPHRVNPNRQAEQIGFVTEGKGDGSHVEIALAFGIDK